MSDILEGAAWTDDCQGKKNFDLNIVQLSTRYWPNHTASASILVRGNMVASKDFEGRSEVEVKYRVEIWARESITKVMDAVVRAFPAEDIAGFT